MTSVRDIPIQNRSVAGRFYSYKNGKLLDFESQLEKKCYLILEFDKSVVSYTPQPLKIERYIPDVLAIRENARPLLIEVKYSKEANNPDDKLRKKLVSLNDHCKKNNMEFLLFTEKNVTEPYYSNIALIYNYANIQIEEQILNKILSIVPKNGISIKKLLDAFNGDIRYIQYIYRLVFEDTLTLNLHSQISLDSIVRKKDD